MMLRRALRWFTFAFVAGVALFTAPAVDVFAAEQQPIEIHVSVNASKSISVSATSYSYGALSVNTSSVSSHITVTNDSVSLIETYRIQGAHALSDTGGQQWTLASSTGTNQYALAAQFSGSQPANTDAAWANDDLTLSAQTCTVTVFGDGTAGDEGVNVSPSNGSNTRQLWFRLKTPDIVTDPTQHTISVTLSVL